MARKNAKPKNRQGPGPAPLRNASHEQFCHEYLKDFNATAAYQRVYPRSGGEAARRSASDLLTKPDVAARIDVLRAELAAKADVETVTVIGELKRIAFSDLRKVYDAHGNLLPIHQLPDDVAAAIAGIEVVTKTVPGSDPVAVAHVVKVKQWDKPRALELLGKYLKLFTEKVEHSSTVTLEQLVAGSRGDCGRNPPRSDGAAERQSAARPVQARPPAAPGPVVRDQTPERPDDQGGHWPCYPTLRETPPVGQAGRVLQDYDWYEAHHTHD